MTANSFHPLDAYSLDELLNALDSRCFALFVTALPRKPVGDGGGGVCIVHRVEWHEYRVLELIAAVELGRAKLLRQAQDAAGASVQPPDDRLPDDSGSAEAAS